MPETAAPPLAPLADAPDQLDLTKETWKKATLDLTSGDTSYARIDYKLWSGKAKAEVAGHAWAFSGRKGWKMDRLEVRDGEDGRQIADVDLSMWSRDASVDLDGASYTMDAEGWLKPEWTCARDGEDLFAIKETGSFGKKKAVVTLTAAGREDPNLGLLLLLTLHAKAASDSAMSVSASTGAIVVASN